MYASHSGPDALPTGARSHNPSRRPFSFVAPAGAAVAAALIAGAAYALLMRQQTVRKPVTLASAAASQSTAFGDNRGGVGAPALLVDPLSVQTVQIRREEALSGQIEPYRVATVSSELNKRIVSRPIEQGSRVEAGSLLALLDSESAVVAVRQAEAIYRQSLAARLQAEAGRAQAVAALKQAESEYARADVETDAAQQLAKAQLQQAQAGEQKTRSFTRSQELRQADAALSQAKTDENLARIETDRYRELVREGAVSQQQFDRAQAALDAAAARRQSAEQGVSLAREGARQEDIASASAQTASARAAVRKSESRPAQLATIRRQIEGLRAQEAQTQAQCASALAQSSQALQAVQQAQIALNRHRILTPFSGRVLATLAEAGEMTAPGSPIAKIGDISRVKATFFAPEASRPSLALGQSVMVAADAVRGVSFTGKITALGYQADPKTRAFPVEVTLANPQERLLPNMIVRLHLTSSSSSDLQRILLPLSAVATDGTSAYVFVLQGETAVRRDVALGAPTGDRVEILKGLRGDERVASTPQRLTDGARIRIR